MKLRESRWSTLRRRLLAIVSRVRWRQLRVSFEPCGLCGRTLLIRLADDEMAVRCGFCSASAVAMSIGRAVAELVGPLTGRSVWELSSSGPLVDAWRRRCGQLQTSEYLEGVPSGQRVDGVLCQDAEAPSFAAACFDLITSTEVFEHVADDRRAFRQMHRLLRDRGWLLFTVPLAGSTTVERAYRDGDRRIELLPAEFHGDRLRGAGKIFCYRNYGNDVVERLQDAGFSRCGIWSPPDGCLFGRGRPVVWAQRVDAEPAQTR